MTILRQVLLERSVLFLMISKRINGLFFTMHVGETLCQSYDSQKENKSDTNGGKSTATRSEPSLKCVKDVNLTSCKRQAA